MAELAKEFEVNPAKISQWKSAFLDNRSIDNKRLIKKIGSTPSEIEEVEKKNLRIVLE